MTHSIRRRAMPGAMFVFLTLCGCRSVAPIILQCPAIPESLTTACETPDTDLETNADLARAYVEAEGCRREDRVKLEAIRELADCRVEK